MDRDKALSGARKSHIELACILPDQIRPVFLGQEEASFFLEHPTNPGNEHQRAFQARPGVDRRHAYPFPRSGLFGIPGGPLAQAIVQHL